jgi:hypothetical protein
MIGIMRSVLPWVAAVLFGALAPALVVAGLSENIYVLPLAFTITLGHALILGLPVSFCIERCGGPEPLQRLQEVFR